MILKKSSNLWLHRKIVNRMWFRISTFTVLVLCYGAYSYATSAEGTIFSDWHRSLADDSCPPHADPAGLVVLYILGIIWLFVGLAIVADEFFCPALDVIGDKWEISPDVCGATLMAAGGSSPELFTSAMGTFMRSSVGFGAIVGSAVFNLFFVIGICGIVVPKLMHLTAWPLIRDSCYYTMVLVVLGIFFGVTSPQVIEWWEALILHGLYYLYVYLMTINQQLSASFYRFMGNSLADQPQEEGTPLSFPSKFRGGIMTLMMSNKPFTATVGTSFVTKLNGSIEEIFAQVDTDKSGTISVQELGEVFKLMGIAASEEDVEAAFKSIDTDGSGQIDKEEFSHWYLTSKTRLHASLQEVFKKIDVNNDGVLSVQELQNAIDLLFPDGPLTQEQKQAALNELLTHDGRDSSTDFNPLNKGEMGTELVGSSKRSHNGSSDKHSDASTPSLGPKPIDLDHFVSWFTTSSLAAAYENRAEAEEEEAEDLSFFPPEEKTLQTMTWYILTLPYVIAFYLTIPNVHKPGWKYKHYITFLVCLAWMGFISYFMVSWTEIVGATIGIPSVIMGLTFLAAGTSVPDMLSAVIVAKQGHADKAVSSSIGSNVFDITVGLAFPWLLFIAVYQESVNVDASSLFIAIFVLVLTVILLILTIYWRKWTLPPSSGYWLIFLYFCYVGLQLGIASWGNC